MNQVQNFLNLLYKYLDNKHKGYFWVNPGRKTYPFTVDNIITGEVTNIVNKLPPNHDIYFGLGTTTKTLSDYERPKNEEISAIPGFWIDIDIQSPGTHKSPDLPTDIAEAMAILPDNLQPSLVVWSGYGIHAYWLFREPWEFDSQDERNEATELLRSLQATVKHNASLRGWKVDTTADLARVLRLPGTQNHKLQTPVLCKIIEQTDIRYNPGDIESLLPAVPETVRTNTDRKTSFERRPTDGQADLMLRNCRFMQHCQLNTSKLSYSEKLAAATNIVRASDGVEAAHALFSLDKDRYNYKFTDAKINEALEKMNPQNCDYIRSVIGFQGCPPNGCNVQAPCGWSLSRVAQARATVRGIPAPTPETVLVPEVLGALAVLKKEDQAEYTRFKGICKGKINLNDLEKAVNQHKKQAKKDHLHVVQDGEKPGKRMLRDTVSDVPIDLFLPPNFKFERSGILFTKENSNGDTMVYKAAGCPVVITERVFNVDTEKEKLEICFKYLKGWRRITLPRSTIFDGRRVMQLADFGVPISSETSKWMVKWFDALSDYNQERIPVTYAVSKLGWRGEREFVLPNLDNKYRVDMDDDGSQNTVAGFTTAGNNQEWVSRMQYLRQSPKARFILSASFAAPLLLILGQRNFIIHNWGTSQDGKTATLWAGMSVWGNPDKIISTFDVTSTNIERKAALFSDLPLAINEREVLSQNKRNDISPLLYMMGEGRGRGRGDKKGLQVTQTWRTITLTTGEGTLSTSGSFDGVMTRVLEISDGPLAHDREFARQLYYFLPRCHGHAGPAFIHQLVQANHNTIIQEYRNFQVLFKSLFPDRIDSHIDAVACVATADYLSSAWIFGELWEMARAGAAATGLHVLGCLVACSEASESGRAWNAFIDWLAENRSRLSEHSSPCIGYIDKPSPQDTGGTYIIRSVIDQFLAERFSSSRKIIREWAIDGKIVSYQEGKNTRCDFRGRTLSGGIRPRVIKIKDSGTGLGQTGQGLGQA